MFNSVSFSFINSNMCTSLIYADILAGGLKTCASTVTKVMLFFISVKVKVSFLCLIQTH